MSRRLLGTLSVVLYVPAWFLTAAHTSGELVGGRSAGWQAFAFAISPIAGNDMGASLSLRTWMVASALSNAVLIVALVLVFWRPRAVNRAVVRALGGATLVNTFWLLLPEMRPDLRVGYFLWLASFALTAVAARATVREVAAGTGARAA